MSTSQGRELTEGHLGLPRGKAEVKRQHPRLTHRQRPGKGGNNSKSDNNSNYSNVVTVIIATAATVLRTVLSALCGLLFNQVLY